MSNSMQSHGLQQARFLCPSPIPGACSNSYPLSQWCHSTFLSSVIPSPPVLNLSYHQGLFQWVSSLHQVAKVLELSFSISPSNEYSGLIFFRMEWFDLAVQGTLKSLLQHHNSKASILGEGNGNPFQCSCLENPRDRGALVGCHLWGRTGSDMTEAT